MDSGVGVLRSGSRLGHCVRVTPRSGQEPAIVSFQEVSALTGSLGNLLEHSEVGESQANGLAEYEHARK